MRNVPEQPSHSQVGEEIVQTFREVVAGALRRLLQPELGRSPQEQEGVRLPPGLVYGIVYILFNHIGPAI